MRRSGVAAEIGESVRQGIVRIRPRNACLEQCRMRSEEHAVESVSIVRTDTCKQSSAVAGRCPVLKTRRNMAKEMPVGNHGGLPRPSGAAENLGFAGVEPASRRKSSFGRTALPVALLVRMLSACSPSNEGAERGSAPTSPPPAVASHSHFADEQASLNSGALTKAGLETTNHSPPQSEEAVLEDSRATAGHISDADLLDVVGNDVKASEWSNLGFASIPSLIQTYYSGMREGNVLRISDCLSQQERTYFAHRQRQGLGLEFKVAVTNVTRYTINSATKLESGQLLITVTHAVVGGGSVLEYLAVVKERSGWKIDGERGYLQYGHHGGNVPISVVKLPARAE